MWGLNLEQIFQNVIINRQEINSIEFEKESIAKAVAQYKSKALKKSKEKAEPTQAEERNNFV